MKNLFTGIEITFNEALISNTKYNDVFRGRDGFEQHMLPEQESSMEMVERELKGWVKHENLKREYEHTKRSNGVVTWYFSSTKRVSSSMRDTLAQMVENGTLTSVKYGSMKDNATFSPSKAKAA